MGAGGEAKQLGVDPATDLDAGDIVGQGQMCAQSSSSPLSGLLLRNLV